MATASHPKVWVVPLASLTTTPCTPVSVSPVISIGVMPVSTCTPARLMLATSATPLSSTEGRARSLGSAAKRPANGDVSSTADTCAPALRYCDATR